VTHFGTTQFKDFLNQQYRNDIYPTVNDPSYVPTDVEGADDEEEDELDQGEMRDSTITIRGSGVAHQFRLDGFDAITIMALRSFVMRERERLAETMERWRGGLATS